MLSAIDVARYFLSLTDDETGDLITNLKLQKLLYYAQGFHLCLFSEPLFLDRIEAWAHGPVVADVYHAYKEHGSNPIPTEEIDFSIYDAQTMEFLNNIYNEFGQYSAWKLREMTHEEPPWKNAYKEDIPGIEISHQSLIDYFSQFVEDNTNE